MHVCSSVKVLPSGCGFSIRACEVIFPLIYYGGSFFFLFGLFHRTARPVMGPCLQMQCLGSFVWVWSEVKIKDGVKDVLVSKGVSYLLELNKHLQGIWLLTEASWSAVWAVYGTQYGPLESLCALFFYFCYQGWTSSTYFFSFLGHFLNYSNQINIEKLSLQPVYITWDLSSTPLLWANVCRRC